MRSLKAVHTLTSAADIVRPLKEYIRNLLSPTDAPSVGKAAAKEPENMREYPVVAA